MTKNLEPKFQNDKKKKENICIKFKWILLKKQKNFKKK